MRHENLETARPPWGVHLFCCIAYARQITQQRGQQLPVSWHHPPPVWETGRALPTDCCVLQSRFGEWLLRQSSGDVTKVAARSTPPTAHLCRHCPTPPY